MNCPWCGLLLPRHLAHSNIEFIHPHQISHSQIHRKFTLVKRVLKSVVRRLLKFVMWFVIVTVTSTLMQRWINPPTTILQLWQGKEGEHFWVPPDELGYHLPLAVIASEDQKFLKHRGFDVDAIRAAYARNQKGKKISGGSTISQQTAKNVFLWPSRSWLRKGLEAYFTVLIELLWPKERIMEVYLNVIEMGPQCFGAGAASKRYFKKNPSQLTTNQAARIAAVLPHPRRSNPGEPTAYVLKRAATIEKQMRNIGGPQILPWFEPSGK